MAIEEVLEPLTGVMGVEGWFLLSDQGETLASAMPGNFEPDSLTAAGRNMARSLAALEASRRRVHELDLTFQHRRLLIRNIKPQILGVMCSRTVNIPLLNLSMGPVVRKLSAELKGDGAAAPGVRKAKATVASSNGKEPPVIAELIHEGERVAAAAKLQGVGLRLMGSAGIWSHCHEGRAWMIPPTGATLELAAATGQDRLLPDILASLGYQPHVRFNAFYGAQRQHYHKEGARLWLDVFLGGYEMYHRVDFDLDAASDDPALGPTWLLLTRLQAVEATETDTRELLALLCDHDVVLGPGHDTIDGSRITGLCTEDWGWYRTATMNLDRAVKLLRELPDLPQGEVIADRIERLRASIENAPKDVRWQMRARVGDTMRWYQTPVQVQEGSRPDLALG